MRILRALGPAVALLLVFEVGLRAWYYGERSGHALAFEELTVRLRAQRTASRARQILEETTAEVGLSAAELEPQALRAWLDFHLYSELGGSMLAEVERRYETRFAELVRAVRAVDSTLVVLYVPAGDFKERFRYRLEHCRGFFRDLAGRFGVRFHDVTEALSAQPIRTTTLLPRDGHPSRYGARLIAHELQPVLDSLRQLRTGHRFRSRPRLLGDFAPNANVIRTEVPALPYRLVTNAQGLRMDRDLEFPARDQRILVLGDSVAFGSYLQNEDAFPNLLDAELEGREVVNAAKPGYTITQQLELFEERARFAEPDITVLQVLDNDLFELLDFMQNLFHRHNDFLDRPAGSSEDLPVSRLELEFIAAVRDAVEKRAG